MPETSHITVETIHSGFAIYRNYDKVVEYSPPTRLRRYDLIILDEGSQVDDAITKMLILGIGELPQMPYVVVAADFQQLNPVTGGRAMRLATSKYPTVTLDTMYRSDDEPHLDFLRAIRTKQPAKKYLYEYFEGRMLPDSLKEAVAYGLRLGQTQRKIFFWLCVTNPGADEVNRAALSLLGITEEQLSTGFPGDPKVHAGPIYVKEGLFLRLSRNLDKPRGFVNGAIGLVVHKLSDATFILRLTTGVLLLVHPVTVGEDIFLPCAYGYATTIRKAQGQSLDLGCLYFNHCYPPDRGYGYVGASRSR
jgi:hypothetical protein